MTRKAVLERTLGKKAAKKFLPEPKKPEVDLVKLLQSSDLLDLMIQAELTKVHGSLIKDRAGRLAGRFPNGIFESDKALDIETIERHIDALELVLRYFSTPSSRMF
jgi:hypothetical protein